MEKILDGKSGQQTVHAPIWRNQIIIKARMNPCEVIVSSPLGVNVRGPGYGKGVHSVFIFQDVSSIERVLASRAGYQAVIASVRSTKPVAQFDQLSLASLPISLAFLFCKSASVADTILVETNCRLGRISRMPELDRGVGPLIGDDTRPAKLHRFGQAIVCGRVTIVRAVKD